MRIQHCGLVNGFLPMSHAVRLLATTALTLEEIALRVGLQNRAQMGAAFRRLYGVTPGAYCRLPPAQRQGEMLISIMDSANDLFIHNPEMLFVQPKRKSIALYAAHDARSKLTATFLKTQLFCQTDHTHIARPGLRVNFILAAIKQIHNECA